MATQDPNYHNKGQEDRSDGSSYEAPHGIIDDLTTWSDEGMKKIAEDNTAYKDGWEHTDDQIKENDGGVCFLTTACVHHAGLDDDCHELEVLRKFRDEYVATLPEGPAMVSQYYASGPSITAHIHGSPRCDEILESILTRVRRAVELIESNRLKDAFDLYSKMFLELKQNIVTAAAS